MDLATSAFPHPDLARSRKTMSFMGSFIAATRSWQERPTVILLHGAATSSIYKLSIFRWSPAGAIRWDLTQQH